MNQSYDTTTPEGKSQVIKEVQLSRRIEATDKIAGHFGDVDITFEVVDY